MCANVLAAVDVGDYALERKRSTVFLGDPRQIGRLRRDQAAGDPVPLARGTVTRTAVLQVDGPTGIGSRLGCTERRYRPEQDENGKA